MTAIVAIDAVAKRYGKVEALRDVGFELEAGKVMALVGHNGAGKTTLMKLMLGLIVPSAGSVRILGQDPAGRRGAAVRRAIGFLPESVAFPGAMSGREIMAFYCRLKGEAPAAGNALLERVGLGEAIDRRVSTYSKGMRQRLGLAQAMIGRPRLLLLDEPTTGLDPALRQEFYAMLDTLRADGVAILLSSHALAEIETKADAFALIGRGRLLACDDLPALQHSVALALRITVRVTPCTTGRVLEAVSGRAEIEARAPDRLLLLCDAAAKVDLLGRIAQLGDIVRDIETERPNLDAIYRALLARQQEALS
ncbi:MAG TPA: ABC transporter ATP-binding protein [Ferrovibrio sp.]|uniref:ABC transporter ATP-binding protein n=1 Tax=Ferrovibrio sp. TaxID=1917215 RepID=UPI002ED38C97